MFTQPTFTAPRRSQRFLDLPQVPGALERVRVAHASGSAIACPKCERYLPHNWLTRDGRHKLDCYNCGFNNALRRFKVDLQPGEERHLSDAAVRETSWFHISAASNWLADVQAARNRAGGVAMVHIGSRAAAMDRLRDIQRLPVPIHLYEVRLRADTPIAPGLFKDKDRWPKYSSDVADRNRFQGYSAAGVTRYMNHYEGCGSVSLLAVSTCLELVSQQVVANVSA